MSHRQPLTAGRLPGTAYQIRQLLAEGGFSLVYMADGPQGQVVVKELFDNDRCRRRSGGLQLEPLEGQAVIHERQKQRCREEWSRFQGFHHPHIVRLLDFFETNNTCYTVMPFVEGESLLDRVVRMPLSLPELMAIIHPLADALDTLHHQSVIHRDVKPDNIWLRASDGAPVLLDTGAARTIERSRRGGSRLLTMLGAPELLGQKQTNRYGQVGPATDVFALAGVCAFALSGQEPPDATLRGLSTDPAGDVLAQWRLPVHEEVTAVIRSGMALKVVDRLQSPGSFARALEQASRSHSISAISSGSEAASRGPTDIAIPSPGRVLDWLSAVISNTALATVAAMLTPDDPLLGVTLFLVLHMATVIYCAVRRSRCGERLKALDMLPLANLVFIIMATRRATK